MVSEKEKCVRDGRADILLELVRGREHYDRNLGIAEHGELLGLLEQTVSSLRVRYLPARLVLYLLHLHLSSPHYISLRFSFFFSFSNDTKT